MPQIKGKQLADAPDGISTAKINANAVTSAKVDGSVIIASGGNPFTGDQSHGGFRITNLANPVAAQDAATKAYVDALSAGFNAKAPVRVLATTNITLSGEQVIDGVLTSASRVGVVGQTNPIENGIYVSGAGAWTRATDLAAGSSAAGVLFLVLQGTTYADTQWVCTTDPPNDIVGTNSLTFVQWANPFTYTFNNGLLQTGSTVNVVPGNASLVATPGSLVVGYGTPVNVGVANATGASVLAARENHVHNAPILNPQNLSMVAQVTVADNDLATATTVARANFGTGAPQLFVNGVGVVVGDGTKVGVDAYISGDGGVTARAYSAIAAGDTIRWNGSVALYQLAATDRISLRYLAFT